MGVDKITYKWSEAAAGTATDNGVVISQSRGLTQYITATSAVTDNEDTLIESLGVIHAGEGHPYNNLMICNNASMRRVGPISYENQCTFETTGFNVQSPDNQAPIITYGYAASEEEVDLAITGLPLLTTVGEDFNPPMRKVYFDRTIKIEKAMTEYNSALWDSYAAEGGAVNSDQLGQYPPGTVRITKPGEANLVVGPSKQSTYFMVSAEFTIRRAPLTLAGIKFAVQSAFPNTGTFGNTVGFEYVDYGDQYAWYRRESARGFYGLFLFEDNVPAVVRFRDNDGNFRTIPTLHYAAGGLAGFPIPNAPGQNSQDTTKAEWYGFPIYPYLPFAALQLDTEANQKFIDSLPST